MNVTDRRTLPRYKVSGYANRIALEHIGARIACVREAAGLTMAEMARRTGMTMNAIANAERGSSISLMAVVRIAKALGVKVDELIPEGLIHD